MTENARIDVPSAATELVQRLTSALRVAFTLTDDMGAVLASSGGRPRGQIDPIALLALRESREMEQEPMAESAPEEADMPAAKHAGLLAAEAGVYVPIRREARIDGVLITHGEPREVRPTARTAAAAVGVALEFARGASLSARQRLGPDLTVHQLLRGTPKEARRAALIAKVIGWDFTVPRVALVVLAPGGTDPARGLGPAHYDMISAFVETVAPATPMGQVHPVEWVLLPELPSRHAMPAPRQLADDVHAALLDAGVEVVIGIGDAYSQDSLPAIRRSYREALYAARGGEAIRARRGVFQLRDLGAAAFLAPSRITRRRLAHAITQRLRAQPDVLQSLHAFLGSNLSFTRTARRTGLHRHTIRNHLDRVRELTGLDPRALEDAFQLRLALLLRSRPRPRS